jgi:hypothetical protein
MAGVDLRMTAMLRRAAIAALGAAGALLVAAPMARGHGLEPALLALRERAPGRFEVTWKSSTLRLPGAQVRPILPDRCRETADAPRASDDGDRITRRWTVDCGPDGLAGQAIAVTDLDVATIDALLRVERLKGSRTETILTAHQPRWIFPADPTRDQLVRHFARLGAATTLANLEPLLLLFGLLLALAATPRRLLQAGVAFILGHALALAGMALGGADAASGNLRLVLPAAVLLVALALTREAAPPRPPRPAWLLALACGAVAGAACRAAWAAASASALDAPLALLAFSAGAALPQLGTLLLARGLSALPARRAAPARRLRYCTGYALGILAVFWCLERLSA